MDKKQQKKLYIAGGATGLVAVVLFVFVLLSWMDTTKQQEYETKIEEWNAAKSESPYPNDANMKLLRDETKEVNNFIGELNKSLSILPKKLEGDFSIALRESVNQLNQKQMPIASADTMLQEYDFKDYLSDGKQPENNKERLLLQYALIEDVVGMLIDVAPVATKETNKKEVQITNVKRGHFEKKDAADAKTKKKTNKKNKDATAQDVTFAGVPVASELSKDIHQESFEISFRTRYNVVAKFLNKLQASDTFYVVNNIEITPVTTLMDEVESKKQAASKAKALTRNARRRGAEDAQDVSAEIAKGRLIPHPSSAGLVDATISFDVYYANNDEKEGK
jgi:hypothetical protein